MATVVMTWPLARGLTHDIPSDLGDPLLNCYIVSWVAEHLLRALGGDIAALGEFWHANIFYPEPYTLALSEHLTAQAVQILPVYAITRNPILCYNLLFLSTFVLSGLGMFLLVRSLTGDSIAALFGGAMYAFLLPRIGQIPHVQVMSIQWMPFALFGLHRFFETRRLAPLAGAAAALVAQNLSCGYFLMYFTPCFVAVAIFEIGTRGLWRDERTWKWLVFAGGAVAIATLPFLMPYVHLRELGLEPRVRAEIEVFSADVDSYFTAAYFLRLWGPILRRVELNEGELFPSWTVYCLAIVALWAAIAEARRQTTSVPTRRWLARIVFGIVLVCAGLIACALLLDGFSLGAPPFELRVHNIRRLIVFFSIAVVGLCVLSPGAFARVRQFAGRREALFLALALAGAVLSCGPIIRSRGVAITDGPYDLLFKYVPGFDGLRVPARFGFVACLFLVILAGMGAAVLRRVGGWRARLVPILAIFFFVEAAFTLPLNQIAYPDNKSLNNPPMRVRVGDEIPDVYKAVQRLPASAALIEFPFGEVVYELRYLYYSIFHWRPLVNGYSGAFPISYRIRSYPLSRALSDGQSAWRAIRETGATHAIVHRLAYQRADGDRMVDWLRERQATVIADTGEAVLFELPALSTVEGPALGKVEGPPGDTLRR